MIARDDIKELLSKDIRFKKFHEEDQDFIVELVQGKTEEFILNHHDHLEVLERYKRASGGTR